MPEKPTNTDLQLQISRLDKKVEKRHSTMLATFAKFRKEVHKELTPFHDYLIGQAALAEATKQGTVSINGEVWNVLKWLVLIIAGLLGAKLL